jgi:hypothetical protein
VLTTKSAHEFSSAAKGETLEGELASNYLWCLVSFTWIGKTEISALIGVIWGLDEDGRWLSTCSK